MPYSRFTTDSGEPIAATFVSAWSVDRRRP
jgi:hypothetical protein